MLVDRVVPIAHKRLATIGYDAPLLEAARLLGGSSDLVVVCGPDGLLKGVITKTRTDALSRVTSPMVAALG